ncbi:MAG: phosphomannomutase, partial [Candidatus Gracilibacteria bacterium]
MNSVDPNIFRAYDIRGVDLTEQTAYLIGRGTGTYLIEKYKVRNIAVGRDNRLSGEMLMEALVRGLLETGLDVVDIGLSVSPIVYWATCARDFDAAINITASHNPKEYNGFKIVAKNAHSICGDELQEILKIIEKKDFN